MFAENFSNLLQRNNISAYKVAKDTDISQGLMNQYKNGVKTPTMDNLIKIADYFSCSTDYLLGRVENPNSTYSVSGNNNLQVNGNNGNNSPLTINGTSQLDEMEKVLLETFRTFKPTEKVKIVCDLVKEAEKKSPTAETADE